MEVLFGFFGLILGVTFLLKWWRMTNRIKAIQAEAESQRISLRKLLSHIEARNARDGITIEGG